MAGAKTKDNMKSFLQTVQFVAQFMRSDTGTPHSDVTAPLRQLTRQNERFEWTAQCQTLTQNHNEVQTPKWKVVHHMNHSLVKSEKNYNKIEGESLAIYSGVLMNRKYLLGAPFMVMTDHSALPAMYNNLSRTAPHRVDRHRGRLSAFNMKVELVSGHKNPCDYGSRQPDRLPENLAKEQREEIEIETEEEDMEVWFGWTIQEVLPEITMEKFKDDTDKDPELKVLLEEK